jgi:hypothetical protein
MNNLASIVYGVHNLDTAKAIKTALLGVGPHTKSPYYVGFNAAGFEIALVPQAPDKTETVHSQWLLGTAGAIAFHEDCDCCEFIGSSSTW